MRPLGHQLLTVLILLGPGALSAPAQSFLCGDCDMDGVVTVLDALVTARLSLGLDVASPLQLVNCDIEGDLDLDILDALAMARLHAGFAITPSCPSGLTSGSLPQVLTVTVAPPAGVRSGAVDLEVVVADLEGDPVDLALELATPGGSFIPATISRTGPPWQRLSSSPGGDLHPLRWDSEADLPEGIGPVRLRVIPFDPGPGTPGEVLVVLNNLAISAASHGPGAWSQPTVGTAGRVVPPGSVDHAPQEHRANLLLDGRLVITGGYNGVAARALADVRVYDPTRHEVILAASLPGGGRVGHMTHVIQRPTSPHHGWLLCAGGTDGAFFDDQIHLLDPASLTWVTLPVSLSASFPQTSVVGAQSLGRGNPSPSAYVGGLASFTTGGLRMEIQPQIGPAYAAQTNLAYQVVLDADGDGDYTDSTVTPILLQFIREVDDPCTVTHHPGTDLVEGTGDDLLVIMGGAGVLVDATGDLVPPMFTPPGEAGPPPGCILADVEIITLSSGAVDLVTSTSSYDTYPYIMAAGVWDHPSLIQRYNHVAVTLADGRLLVASGTNAFGDIEVLGVDVPITPAYDLDVMAGVRDPLTTQSFYLRPDPLFPGSPAAWLVEVLPYPLGVLEDPRGLAPTGHVSYAEAARLPGGDVLLAGGDDMRTLGSAATSSAQRFLLATGEWVLTGSLQEGRALHTLTALPGEVVAALGGVAGAGVLIPIETYELYEP